MENGSSASRIERVPKRAAAMLPFPPVVFTESVTVLIVVPSMGSGFGEMEQVEPLGPEQVKPTEPVKLLSGATESMY